MSCGQPRDHCQHREGCQCDDPFGDAKHYREHAAEHVGHRLGTRSTEARESEAEQGREYQCRQHLLLRHGRYHIAWNQIEQKLRPIDSSRAHAPAPQDRLASRCRGPGMKQCIKSQADRDSNCASEVEPAKSNQRNAAKPRRVQTHLEGAERNGAKHQRNDHHLHGRDECATEWLQRGARCGPDQTDERAEGQCDADLSG